MAKRKARKKDDIRMAFHVEAKRPIKKSAAFLAMVETARTGKPLPKGLEVTWRWQNSRKSKWREAPLRKAVRESRAGFIALILKRLAREGSQIPGFVMPVIREAREAELQAIEDELDFYEDKRESAGHRKGGGTRAREVFEKRSAAAKKGWKTRKAAAAKKAGRKPAAKKGKRK